MIALTSVVPDPPQRVINIAICISNFFQPVERAGSCITDTAEETADERTGQQKECRATGRTDGLIGTYDIWLCRQSFREMARDMGFRKYD